MFKKKNVIIYWILVIIWLGVIFFFSSKEANKSDNESKGLINKIVSIATWITNSDLTEEEQNQFMEKLNYPVRKMAHMTEYFILTSLIIFALKRTGLKGKKVFLIALLSCFLYAIGDEYHQTFVDQRTGQFSDVLIDTFGGFLICLIMYIIYQVNIKKSKKVKDNKE